MRWHGLASRTEAGSAPAELRPGQFVVASSAALTGLALAVDLKKIGVSTLLAVGVLER